MGQAEVRNEPWTRYQNSLTFPTSLITWAVSISYSQEKVGIKEVASLEEREGDKYTGDKDS